MKQSGYACVSFGGNGNAGGIACGPYGGRRCAWRTFGGTWTWQGTPTGISWTWRSCLQVCMPAWLMKLQCMGSCVAASCRMQSGSFDTGPCVCAPELCMNLFTACSLLCMPCKCPSASGSTASHHSPDSNLRLPRSSRLLLDDTPRSFPRWDPPGDLPLLRLLLRGVSGLLLLCLHGWSTQIYALPACRLAVPSRQLRDCVKASELR